MLNVVALYPAFDVRMNEMAMVWKRLCANAPVRCSVLAHSYDGDKGQLSTQETEELQNLEVHRAPTLDYKSFVQRVGASKRPDIIFCAVKENFHLARHIHRSTGAPIVLHTEFFLDNSVFLNRRHYFGISPARPFFSSLWRSHFHKHARMIFVSNPQEFSGTSQPQYPRLRYLPWPHPPGAGPRPTTLRDLRRGAYVGSIRGWKGATTLLGYFTHLLEQKPEFSVDIVGPPMDDIARDGIATLVRTFGSRVRHTLHLARDDARTLMAEVLFVLSPGRKFGWGQIGDSWICGTPVIAANEHYDLRAGVNCLVARDKEEFVQAVGSLQDDSTLRATITAGGFKSVAAHSLDAVASILHAELLHASQGT